MAWLFCSAGFLHTGAPDTIYYSSGLVAAQMTKRCKCMSRKDNEPAVLRL